jgi:predicted nucleic acid-binding Zn ribbon protein
MRCVECGNPLPPGSRSDRRTCSTRCRIAMSRRLRQGDGMTVTISYVTLDAIYDSWCHEHGMGRFSHRWSVKGRQARTDMTMGEAQSLARYLRGRLALVSGPGIEREPGELPALRRDVARLASV